jgi:hypothetical protein
MYLSHRGLNFCILALRPPLWSSAQSYWLQIQRSAFDSRHYQIFWEAVGMERGSLSFVSTIEELLRRKSSGSGLENREYGRKDLLCWQCNAFYPQKLALTSQRSVSSSVGIVRSRTKATEFVFVFYFELSHVLTLSINSSFLLKPCDPYQFFR